MLVLRWSMFEMCMSVCDLIIAVCKVIGPDRPAKLRPNRAKNPFCWPTSAAGPADHF